MTRIQMKIMLHTMEMTTIMTSILQKVLMIKTLERLRIA